MYIVHVNVNITSAIFSEADEVQMKFPKCKNLVQTMSDKLTTLNNNVMNALQ